MAYACPARSLDRQQWNEHTPDRYQVQSPNEIELSVANTSQNFTRTGYIYARVAGSSSLCLGTTVVLEAYTDAVCLGYGVHVLVGLYFGYSTRGKHIPSVSQLRFIADPAQTSWGSRRV